RRHLHRRSKRVSRRTVIIWAAVLLPLIIAATVVGRELWRESINIALIEPIDRDDTEAAILLLNIGAEAKIKDIRRVSAGLLDTLYNLRDRLMGRKLPPEEAAYPEAIIIKAYRVEDGRMLGQLESSPLLGALLDHGADASALSSNGVTVLHWAVMSD